MHLPIMFLVAVVLTKSSLAGKKLLWGIDSRKFQTLSSAGKFLKGDRDGGDGIPREKESPQQRLKGQSGQGEQGQQGINQPGLP